MTTLRATPPLDPPFCARLGTGQAVQIERIGPDTPRRQTGDPELSELRALIASLLTLNPLAAEAHGINLPTAWLATTAGDSAGAELGIAWWTPLPWHRLTAIAEVKLSQEMNATGLGRLLLDLVVMSATERGVEWLQVRLPGDDPELARAVASLRGRALTGDEGANRFEIPLGTRSRRFHRSGVHHPVRRATA
jgi:hypothetical protein